MYWSDHGMTGWGFALMILIMVLAWALVAVAIIATLRIISAPPRSHSPVGPGSPEQVLADRFARGDIDDDEYQRRLAALRAGLKRA